jgi:CheY-like chemotaxis protein
MKKLSNDLKGFGHNILEASEGLGALNIYYNNDDIDLIITDLAMPHDKERLKSILDSL